MADVTLHVEGLRELNRAFRIADRTLHLEMRARLRLAAEPVRADAESLALSGISRIGLRWSQMRVGVTAKSVYVAPKQRGVRGRGSQARRPNLAELLTERAMDPAAERGKDDVVRAMENLLDDVGRNWERA